MTEDAWTSSSAAFAPAALVAYALICAVAFVAWLRLRRQWERLDLAFSTRVKEFSALSVAVLCLLALVAVGAVYLQQRALQQQLAAELRQRTATAADLRRQMQAQLAVARDILADRAVQKISEQKVAEARAELARFAPFGDARITRMLVLLDAELEIRRLVRLALQESEPARLLTIYQRLASLDPDHSGYRERIVQYEALVATGAPASPSAASRP